MRLLGWKRMSRRRRAKLQGWKNTAKKCAAIIAAATLITTFARARPVDTPTSIVLMSTVSLAGMVAWLWYHMHKEWRM